MPPAKVDPDAVRSLWERRLTDTAIAQALGWDRETVRKNRRLLGLPPAVPHSELPARSGGGKALAAARVAAHERRRKALALRYGLPGDLAAVQVAVLLALALGPLTANELADRCGRSKWRGHRGGFSRFSRCRRRGKNYLTDLKERGLVAHLPRGRGKGNGRGRGEGLYLLTPKAMELLAHPGEGGGLTDDHDP